jgi:hypothetical protein
VLRFWHTQPKTGYVQVMPLADASAVCTKPSRTAICKSGCLQIQAPTGQLGWRVQGHPVLESNTHTNWPTEC